MIHLKVIGFFSGSGETGTTMTALSVAEELAEQGNKTIFIYGSGKKGNTFIKDKQLKGLDYIRADLVCGNITAGDIKQIMGKQGDLRILAGTESSYDANLFPLETFEVMLPALKNFDFVVIDGGNHFESAMTISALNVSTDLFFIVTQQIKAIERFKDTQERVLKPLEKEISIIINRYKKEIALPSITEIERIVGREVSFVVSDIKSSWQYEVQGCTLRKQRKYRKEVRKIADGIVKG